MCKELEILFVVVQVSKVKKTGMVKRNFSPQFLESFRFKLEEGQLETSSLTAAVFQVYLEVKCPKM